MRKLIAAFLLFMLATAPVCQAGVMQDVESRWGIDKQAHFNLGATENLGLKLIGDNITDKRCILYGLKYPETRVGLIFLQAFWKEKTDSKFDWHDIGAQMTGVAASEVAIVIVEHRF